MIGAMNRIEIWDTAAWQPYSDEQEQAFADLTEEVFPGSEHARARQRTPTAGRNEQPCRRGFNPQV